MNVKLLYDNTESLSYETNIFECFKDKAYNSAETKLSDKEYTLLANSLNRHHDQIFKDNYNKFLDIPLRDWPKKIKEYETMLSIQDTSSVGDYLRVL